MKFKLPKDVKKKWVAALRSGKYEQGRQFLESNGEYCCLGVAVKCGLAEVHVMDRNHYTATNFLPKRVQNKLADFNDGRGISLNKRRSFKWIASYIERYL